MIETAPDPLLVLDAEHRVVSANAAFYRSFETLPVETEGRLLNQLGNHQWDIPALNKLLTEVLVQSSSFADYQVEHDFPDIGRKVMLVSGRRIERKVNGTALTVLAIRDITSATQRYDRLRIMEQTQAVQRERQRLATRLHDHLQQLLVEVELDVGGRSHWTVSPRDAASGVQHGNGGELDARGGFPIRSLTPSCCVLEGSMVVPGLTRPQLRNLSGPVAATVAVPLRPEVVPHDGHDADVLELDDVAGLDRNDARRCPARALDRAGGRADPEAFRATGDGLMTGCIRVVVADDHSAVRAALAKLLQDADGIHVIGEAQDGEGAVELTCRLQPDVVLMDILMPRMSGIEATRRIAHCRPTSRVVGLSFHEDELSDAICKAGAVTFVPKACEPAVLTEAVRFAAGLAPKKAH